MTGTRPTEESITFQRIVLLVKKRMRKGREKGEGETEDVPDSQHAEVLSIAVLESGSSLRSAKNGVETLRFP